MSDTDKYGRLLRYVWLERPSSDNPSHEDIARYMYNAQLVINGYAYSYSYQQIPGIVTYLPSFSTRLRKIQEDFGMRLG